MACLAPRGPKAGKGRQHSKCCYSTFSGVNVHVWSAHWAFSESANRQGRYTVLLGKANVRIFQFLPPRPTCTGFPTAGCLSGLMTGGRRLIPATMVGGPRRRRFFFRPGPVLSNLYNLAKSAPKSALSAQPNWVFLGPRLLLPF